MQATYYTLLLYILDNAGVYGRFKTSTIKLAKVIGSTQQTISRNLIEMEKQGLIRRAASVAGIVLQLDTRGIQVLQEHYRKLKAGFDKKIESVKGRVRIGLGEGRYYVSLPGYWKQFQKRFGFKPYFGTLNLYVKDYEKLMLFLHHLEEVYIANFETAQRTFGSLKAYRVKVREIDAALVVPERSRHPKEIIEVIAPINLRKKFKLKESDEVVIS